jgi:hypothetical protein
MNTPTKTKCDRTPTKAICDRTPTPRTDEEWAAWPYAGPGISVHFGRELERELAAVTEQRDGLRSGIDYASDQLHKVTEQRDRLAEAVNAATILIAAKGRHNTMLAYNGLREALQSLTTNVNVLAPAGEKTPTKQENE